jgi:hypothetical protein|tara:strand:+ start:1204 stop:1410 length:207 start_codon:yes stop_codon:yes gene_type:complete
MKTEQDYRNEIDRVGEVLGDVELLVSALSVVAEQLQNMSAHGEMHILRNAVVGISRALDREIHRWDQP